ncbi:hypothetical protein Hanom_Chr05g00476351 [Helianthus anomalus]
MPYPSIWVVECVNPQLRRLGEMERARVHVMLYQMLPLAYVHLYGP